MRASPQPRRAGDQGCRRAASDLAGTIKPDQDKRADFHDRRHTGKDVVYSRLRIQKPGPGYIHFPIGGAFDAEYFAQLTSEAVQTRFKEGRPYRVWVLPDGRRNEALDTAVYALAARHATRVRLDLLPRPASAPSPAPDPPEGGPPVFPPDMPPPSLQRRRRGRVIVRSQYLMGE